MQTAAHSRPVLAAYTDPWDSADYGSEFDGECNMDHEQERKDTQGPIYMQQGTRFSLSGSAPRNDWISSVTKSPLTTQNYSAKPDISAQLRRTSCAARIMRDLVIPVDLSSVRWEEISGM